MSDKKLRKVTVQLNPVQMVWLHSQHLFQKIEESSYLSQSEIKFFKNNAGVQIRFQGNEGHPDELLKARDELIKVINSNEIKLIDTSLHKDLYIRISKEARKEFPKSYIIFLHYETFQNCCRKLQEKFNITSITPELERLRKINSHFCFLVAEKQKIDDIQKFTNRILHSEVSCASTTFSHRREQPHGQSYKRTMSVSSLRGSFSEQNDEQYRLSIHPNPVEEQLFQMSESIILKLPAQQMESIKQRKLYEGCLVNIQKYEGTYLAMTKKLYYANRLQLTANPYMQPIYAYEMIERTPYRWALTLVSDKKYKKLSQVCHTPWMANYRNKIQLICKIGHAILILHNNLETYSGLSYESVLLDSSHNMSLSAAIQKDIPPHTNAFVYDIRRFLLLIYRMFTEIQLTYEMLVFKQQKQEYFCTLSHRCKNPHIRQFLDCADKLFIGEYDLAAFLQNSEYLKNG